MKIEITFPGGDRVDARFEDRVIETDQAGSAPAPFDLFLASIGTCAGIYVSRFCQQRGIDPREIRVEQRTVARGDSHMVERVELEILLPESFPDRYRDALIRAAGLCSVKKHLEHPPAIEVTTTKQQLAPRPRSLGVTLRHREVTSVRPRG
jgi:ribosomal protein S12 methylthiotransferase accessory factor